MKNLKSLKIFIKIYFLIAFDEKMNFELAGSIFRTI